MAAAYAYLRDVKPYKTSWKVQVRVLHSWKTYSTRFGETFDMVLADVQVSLIPINRSFAEQVSSRCEHGGFEMVICLVRFAKIKTYNDKRSISNAFNASQVVINPEYAQIVEFKNNLANDGLAISLIEKKQKPELQLANSGEFYHQFPRKSIKDISDMIEEARVKLICTIYAMVYVKKIKIKV